MNAVAPASSGSMFRPVMAAITLAVALSAAALPARATTIQRVVSPGGVEAWLVQEPAVPLIALDFAFAGGSVQDPPGKGGTANLVASLLDEGAGDLDSKAFADQLDRKAIEMNFYAARDKLGGSLRTLSENRDAAFDMLRLALNAPRFDAADVELNRAQVLSMLRKETTSPGDIASRRWWETAFPDHPYGRPVGGTQETVPNITVDDLKAYTHRVLARQNLKVAVVGDIDAETLKPLLDRVFGALPAKPDLIPVANVVPQGLGRIIDISLDVPQAVVDFGGPGIARQDPDFMPAYLINHILGGGDSQLAALSRSPRKARPRLFGRRQPDLARSFRALPRRHRHARRPRDRNDRSRPKRNTPLRRARPDGRGARRGQELCQKLVRAQSR